MLPAPQRRRSATGGGSIRAGEFLIPKGASPSQVLTIIRSDDVLRRFVAIPEGMPAIMVQEKLMKQQHLTGEQAFRRLTLLVGPGARIAAGAEVGPRVVLGAGARVAAGVAPAGCA